MSSIAAGLSNRRLVFQTPAFALQSREWRRTCLSNHREKLDNTRRGANTGLHLPKQRQFVGSVQGLEAVFEEDLISQFSAPFPRGSAP